ncbi:hypothetical protein V5O48_002119 [Marasmius crinis-equi]|uniref:UDENN domain-containing protein n=1 Tax=Marasmius crinis-equi TaxID=585013 RepID=A0ABR3FWG7_9AGAR
MSFPQHHDDHDQFLDDDDTASQRSISLSSPSTSQRNSLKQGGYGGKGHAELLAQLNLSSSSSATSRLAELEKEDKEKAILTPSTSTSTSQGTRPYSSDFTETEADNASMYARSEDLESPNTSIAPSVLSFKDVESAPASTVEKDTAYPPQAHRTEAYGGDAASIASASSTGTGKKVRPESMLLPHIPEGKLILGIALVDFNHLVGPKIEYSKGDIFEDEEIAKMLPFLALPDGAHLSAEDYSYFHIVPTSTPNPTTIFGISCNQQIASSALLVKAPDVTRSTVQKAVVVLASKPVFGPIRDKLGVVTTVLFNQRDFTSTEILDDFAASLEPSLRGQLTESGLYMGTSLRSLVQTFRHRTLILVKALMIQRRIMFTSHPVERLCTFQYSLVSLLPDLLQTLDDCGSPPLASRASSLERPTELRTSDPRSMRKYLGLPMDLFGRDAFFQPYLPLQQLDMLKETKSWLCGSTNSIVTQQKEVDLLVNAETGTVEFRSTTDPRLEAKVGLTAADRKWMEDIIRDVNESGEGGMQFRGSDDYLRLKFEEYISAALAAVRYRDFLAKNEGTGVVGGTGAEATSAEDFNPLWIAEFKHTNAYEVWDRTTDPSLFDIVEPRHPCIDKPSIVGDIGLRFQEGIVDLKLDQQLAPAREAVSRTFTAGSTSFFNAVEGVRSRWNKPAVPTSTGSASGADSPPIEVVSKAELDGALAPPDQTASPASTVFGNFTRPTLWSRRTSSASTASAASNSSQSQPNTPNTPTPIPEAPQDSQTASPRSSGTVWGSFVGRFSLSRGPTTSNVQSPGHERSPSASVESLDESLTSSRDSGPSSTRNSTVSVGSSLKIEASPPVSHGIGDVVTSPATVSPLELNKTWQEKQAKANVPPPPEAPSTTVTSEPRVEDPATPVSKRKDWEEPKTPVAAKTVVPPIPPVPTATAPVNATHSRTQSEVSEDNEAAYSGVAL